MNQQHGNAGRCFSDHRHIEQFLQAFTPMFAVTGLDYRVIRLVVGQYPLHISQFLVRDGTLLGEFHLRLAEVLDNPVLMDWFRKLIERGSLYR